MTYNEQKTLVTLWCIFRSPLFLSNNITQTDSTLLSLITNNEVVEVDQNSTSNRQLYSKDSIVPWVADVPQTNTTDKYLALFNTRMKSKEIKVSFSELGISNECKVRDLWQKKDIEKMRDYH